MPDSARASVFLVDPYADPVLVRIDGRASLLNSGGLKDFFTAMLRQGKQRFVIDFQRCASMDSTFLGVVAGLALELRKKEPPGSLTLCRLGPRNLELVRNLGLHRLLLVDAGGGPADPCGAATALTNQAGSELENARMVLEAHENLVTAEATNAAKFQDVLAFLRQRVESP